MAIPRYTGKELTRFLRALAMEAESLADDGTVVTKAHSLAQLLWRKALGYKAVEKTRHGVAEEVDHPPESWAIQLIYDRLEGKVAPVTTEEGGRLTTSERVSDLAKTRLNNLAVAGVTTVAPMKPPKLPRKKSDGNS